MRAAETEFVYRGRPAWRVGRWSVTFMDEECDCWNPEHKHRAGAPCAVASWAAVVPDTAVSVQAPSEECAWFIADNMSIAFPDGVPSAPYIADQAPVIAWLRATREGGERVPLHRYLRLRASTGVVSETKGGA